VRGELREAVDEGRRFDDVDVGVEAVEAGVADGSAGRTGSTYRETASG
jgi:hypothetical protein